jgi:hypothetical protein
LGDTGATGGLRRANARAVGTTAKGGGDARRLGDIGAGLVVALVASHATDLLRSSQAFDDPGELLAAALDLGLEGIVSKKRDSLGARVWISWLSRQPLKPPKSHGCGPHAALNGCSGPTVSRETALSGWKSWLRG